MSTKPAGRPDAAASRRGRTAVQITFAALALAYLMSTVVHRAPHDPVEREPDVIVYVNRAPPSPAPGAIVFAQPSPVPEVVPTQLDAAPLDDGSFSLETATTFEIPADASAPRRRAQEQLQAFCRAAFASRDEPPRQVFLDWKPTGEGTLAAMEAPEPPAAPIDAATGRPFIQVTEPSGNPALVRVDDVPPAEGQGSPYTLYAFQRQADGTSDFVSNDLIVLKQWEPAEVGRHIRALDTFARAKGLRREQVYFVDIGANVGVFSLAAAAAGFSVIAVEAMSVNAYALSMSLCANARSGAAARTTLFPVALSRECKQCTLYSRQANALDGTLRCDPPGVEPKFSDPGMVKRQEVEVTRLDDLLGDWLPKLVGHVGSLKMDTEGFEPWVVEGGARFFSTVKPPYMQVEVSEAMSIDATGVGPADLLRGFFDAGYSLNVITRDAANYDLKPEEVEIKWNVDVCMWQRDAFGAQGP